MTPKVRPDAAHATVIGAGVIGLTTAWSLVRRGMQVTVVDAGEGPAAGTSNANGGQLSYSYTDAMAAPALLRQLPGFLLGLDPAFRLRPTLNPAFFAWGARLLAECTASAHRSNTLSVLALALESRRVLRDLQDRHALAFRHRAAGKLVIYRSEKALDAVRRSVAMKQDAGCPVEVLGVDAALDKEPALSQAGRFSGAVFASLDEAGDARLFCERLAHVLERQFGVRFVYQCTVTGFRRDSRRVRALMTTDGEREVDALVLSAGVQSAHLARLIDIRLPIWPVFGYSLTLPARPLAPEVSITDASRKIVLCRLGDVVRIAGMADVGPQQMRRPARRQMELRKVAEAAFPLACNYRDAGQPWVGARPMTPDSRPIIGCTPFDNVFLNCGHGMLGWTLACGSAERLAQVVMPGVLPLPVLVRSRERAVG